MVATLVGCIGVDIEDSYGKILKSCQALITMAVPIVIVESFVMWYNNIL